MPTSARGASTASTWTASGREVMRRARPEIPCCLAPLDPPWCVEAALRRARPGDIVLVPSVTFLASANMARETGAEVVLVDVDHDQAGCPGKGLGVAAPKPPGHAVQDVINAQGRCKQCQPVGIGDLTHDQPLHQNTQADTGNDS